VVVRKLWPRKVTLGLFVVLCCSNQPSGSVYLLFVDGHELYTTAHDRAKVKFSLSMATRLTILIRLKVLTPPDQQISP